MEVPGIEPVTSLSVVITLNLRSTRLTDLSILYENAQMFSTSQFRLILDHAILVRADLMLIHVLF